MLYWETIVVCSAIHTKHINITHFLQAKQKFSMFSSGLHNITANFKGLNNFESKVV
jgi:hypothetical protein